MENIVESFEHEGLKINIWHDQDPIDPREWDNIGKMVCFHNRYKLGDDHNFRDPQELDAFLVEEKDNLYILPLYLYDHSGITISTKPFNCPWDSGQVGYIYMTKKRAEEEGLSDPFKTLEHEVKEYNHYLVGNCYGYTIEDKDGEFLESCGGFLGYEDFAKEEAIEMAKYLDRTLPKQYDLAIA